MIPLPPSLLTPLLKVGAVVLVLALVYGLGQWQGRAAIQQEWDAAVMQQQLRAGEFIVKQGQETVRASRVHQEQLRHLSDANRQLSKKVRAYEQSAHQCELSAEFESTFDSISRMREPATDGVSAAPESTGVADAADHTRLTDAAVLPAYQGAVSQLYQCADQLNTLIEWERNSKRIAAEAAGRAEP